MLFDRPRSVRGWVSALVVVLVAWTLTASFSTTASGGPIKGSLAVISVNDAGTGLVGAVQGRPFSVVVEVQDDAGAPVTLSRDTTVVLSEVSGPGDLSGALSAVITRGNAQATISGAVYSTFANGVVLEVTATDGVALSPASSTVNVAATAVSAEATPGQGLEVTDPSCITPSPSSPVCGYLLLPNGAKGTILMSVGSCGGILDCRADPTGNAGLVTAEAVLKDDNGAGLYSKTAPATIVLGCDKSLCSNGGVPHFVPMVDVTNSGEFSEATPCPAKGVLGEEAFCLDTVQSKRDGAGDLYSVILFDYDIRLSHP